MRVKAIQIGISAKFVQTGGFLSQSPVRPPRLLYCRNLVLGVRSLLSQSKFTQSPGLECSSKWTDTPFITHPL